MDSNRRMYPNKIFVYIRGNLNQSTASKQLYHSSWRGTLKTTTFIIRGMMYKKKQKQDITKRRYSKTAKQRFIEKRKLRNLFDELTYALKEL